MTLTSSPDRVGNRSVQPPLPTTHADRSALIVRAAWIALVLPFALQAVAIVRANRAWLVHRFPDDAFYYLEVARHLGRGEGFTFDGVFETNGFHPAWQFALAPISAVFRGETAFMKATLLVGLACVLVATLLVVRVISRAAGRGAALAAGLVFAYGAATFARAADGMEGAVVLLVLALLLTSLAAFADDPSPRRSLLVGLATFGIVIARLDMAAVAWIPPAAMLLRARSWQTAKWWSIGAAVPGLLFAGWWYLRWGHVLTTSASVKQHGVGRAIDEQFGSRASSGYLRYLSERSQDYLTVIVEASLPTRGLRGPLVGLVTVVTTGLALVGAGSAVAARWRGKASGAGGAGWALGVVAMLVVLKAVVDLVSAPLWAAAWYSAPQRALVALALGGFAFLGVRRLAERFPAIAPVSVVAVTVVVAISLVGQVRTVADADRETRQPGYWQDELDLAADWVVAEGPSGRYGARDAGLLGYRLDGVHTLVNLDGLVNDYDFVDLVRDEASLIERARSRGVDLLIGRFPDPEGSGIDCGRVLWESPHEIAYRDTLYVTKTTRAPVTVVDVRPCG